MKIILDPGHGSLGNPACGLGRDPGTCAPDGTRESEVALDHALTLKHVLTQAGFQVVLTRSTEVKTPYGERTALCGPGDLFISVHLNMPGSYGLMYYRTGDRPSLAAAVTLARWLGLTRVWATRQSRFGRLYIDDVPRSARTVMIEVEAIDRVVNTREARLAWAGQVLRAVRELT